MPPTVDEDLVFYRGATFTEQYSLLADGVAMPLTGYTTAKMQVRASFDDAAEVLLTLTTANGGLVIAEAAGTVDIVVTDEQTAALTAGEAVYDLDLYHTSGSVYRFMRGAATILPRSTQP
jgi:hypothetical protein